MPGLDAARSGWNGPAAAPVPPIGWMAGAGAAVLTLAVLAAGLRFMGLSGAVGLADYGGLMLLVVPIAAIAVWLAWLNGRVWVYAALGVHLMSFMSALVPGIAVGDLVFSAVVLVGLPVWFIKEVVVLRRPIVRTHFDVLFIGLIVSTSIVAFVANRLHGGDLLHFVKEISPTLDLLLYFPVRAVIRTRKDVVRLLVLFGTIGLVVGIQAIGSYRERLMSAVYAWQAASSRVFANEPLSMALLVAAAAATAYARRMWLRTAGVIGMGLALVFLIVSFSRGAFGAGVIGVIVVMIFARRRGARRIAAGMAIVSIVGIGTVFIAFPRIADSLATQVSKRIGSISQTASDESFGLRVIEARSVIERFIPESPWIGYGYGTPYSWYSPSFHFTYRGTFIHNGYVRPFFKFGLPLGALFLLFLLYPVVHVFTFPMRRMDAVEHGLLVACLGYLVAALVNNYVSDMFSHFSGPFNYIVCWVIIDYLDRQVRQPSPLLLTAPATAPSQPGGAALS